MPEGDTVYAAAKRMAAALSGKQLTRGALRHPRLAEHDLSGRTVLGVRSVRKHLFTRFDDGRSLHTHFRMDGSWHLYQPGRRWRRPSHQAHAVLTTQDRVAVDSCCTTGALGHPRRTPAGGAPDPCPRAARPSAPT
jgi:endonuclease-8